MDMKELAGMAIEEIEDVQKVLPQVAETMQRLEVPPQHLLVIGMVGLMVQLELEDNPKVVKQARDIGKGALILGEIMYLANKEAREAASEGSD